jgi:hypothetical protein
MKHLIPFRIYEAQTTSGLTKRQVKFLNKYTTGAWSVNPTTGLVDVQGNFFCYYQYLKSLSGISFGHVNGNFNCNTNQLTSLEGAPNTVSENFVCFNNRLTSLEGAPQTVGNYFDCSLNQLQTLEGAPQRVGDSFDCSRNELRSLVGAPHTINGDFLCDEFKLDPGKWNMEGWLEVLNTGTPQAKKLILTLPWLQPDWWNLELQRDPGKTVHLLGSAWNHMPKEMQSAIKIPKGYEGDFELFSGFDELGLF